ncbi:MAG: hypothetical protein DMF44_01515 [Verrucomicrobia bacterium]|nr:MAG: hypothetical protein DMF44_01515 [Verrucomicrobiota bacterium]
MRFKFNPFRCPSPLHNATNCETLAVSRPKVHFLGSAAESKMVPGYTVARIDLSSRPFEIEIWSIGFDLKFR